MTEDRSRTRSSGMTPVTKDRVAKASRYTEIGLAWLGAFLLAGDKVAAWFGVATTFTFSDFVISALLIAPFTLGRATAGKVWISAGDAIATRFGKKS